MPVWLPKNKQELLGSHFYIHAFYNRLRKRKSVKGWPMAKIIKFHAHYVQLFKKKGWKHNSPIPRLKK